MNMQEKLEQLLPLVQRPTRYIDHEWNSCPPQKKEVALCLCFPDIYEVGASNLGIEILYHIVNRTDFAHAERCFCPAADMEDKLRTNNLPLFSLESHTPLAAFDIVGFSLAYELCATNILHMLDLAGLPLLAADRADTFPLIVGGGPTTANPEPYADFFDAFVLGEGEDAVVELAQAVRAAKQAKLSKKDTLLRLAQIPGVYVPSLYEVTYNDDGTLAAVKPAVSGIPARIEKRTVKISESYYPAKKIVPYLQTVHDRLNIEVARGCPGRCRFCQASKYYWPWRMRPVEQVLALTEEGLAATGYEEVAFSSLSCTDYKDLAQLLAEVNRRFGHKRVNISLPSLRCDQFSLAVADSLGHNKRPNLTFAPEAGTERLRYAIGKNLPEADIQNTLVRAFEMGWRAVKLYFMVGLPTETDTDIDGIGALLRAVRQRARGMNFGVTLSPFVPKAQTAFQWMAMATPEVLRGRLQRISKGIPATVKTHFVDGSILEGIFARGDRRLSRAIIAAWKKGCRFDQWKEQMKPDVWREAFREAGIDTVFYLHRERGEAEVLPWDHLHFAHDKEFLWSEYQKALGVTEMPAPVASAEPVARAIPPARVPRPQVMPQVVQRLRLRFGRRGVVRFLSHLEQIELFRRTVRRADLPVAYTGGFSPQIKMSFGPAVSVGHESDSEYFEVEMTRRMEPEEVAARVTPILPEGYTLLSVRKVPVFFPSLDSLLNVTEYRVGASVTQEAIDALLARPEIMVEKIKKDGRVERIDARPLIVSILPEAGGAFVVRMRFGPKRNVKPEKILPGLLGCDDNAVKNIPMRRTNLLIEKKDGSIAEP